MLTWLEKEPDYKKTYEFKNMKYLLKKKVYYILLFVLIWLLTVFLSDERIWVYNDALINGETVMMPDYELKPEIVSEINLLVALSFTHFYGC